MQIVVLTSNRYLWLLRPFAYLFNKYWSNLQPILVAGYNEPDFPLPENFSFFPVPASLSPAKLWSNSLTYVLNKIEDSHVVILLEDYWITRTVDVGGVRTLGEYAQAHENILRLDLTNDRLHARGDARDAQDLEAYGHYDLIWTGHDTPYQVSLQGAIWNRKHLLSILVPDRSPWEFEIYSNLSERPDLIVVGTRQWPLRYANVMLKGAFQWDEFIRIPMEHRLKIQELGWIREAGKPIIP